MNLYPRELEAVRLQALGLDPLATADLMGISPNTVRQYRERARIKLGVQTAIDAFRALGWLQVPPHTPGGASLRRRHGLRERVTAGALTEEQDR